MIRGNIVTLVTLVALLLLPAVASANPITVNTTADQNGTGAECSLREAIASANTDTAVGGCAAGVGTDTIGFSVNGTIDLHSVGPLTINSDLQIQGPGAGLLTLTTANPYRVLEVNSGHVVSVSGLTVTGGSFTAPGPVIDGGGIRNAGTLTLDHVVVTGNKVQLTVNIGTTPLAIVRGGGISNFGTLTVRDSTVSGNTVQATGTGGTTSNGASANGGGIYSQGPGALTVEGSTVSGNHLSATATGINPSAGSEGGGIFNATFGSFTVSRSTITGNINAASGGPADTNGGGIFDDSLKLRATSDTIAANSGAPAANLTGAVMITPGEHVADTILADPLGGGANCDGVVLSDGFNLEDGGSCSLNASTDVHAPAGLAPLGSNGGLTQTMALTPGSAAIDRGSAFGAAADQRGSPRISDFGAIGNAADASDIGAFELRDSFPPQTKIRKVKHKNGRTKITFSSSEAGSTFLCRLDRKRFKPCRSPVTLKHLRPGKKHRFQVEAVDVAGNVDPSPARVKFKKT